VQHCQLPKTPHFSKITAKFLSAIEHESAVEDQMLQTIAMKEFLTLPSCADLQGGCLMLMHHDMSSMSIEKAAEEYPAGRVVSHISRSN
jgi:hypothetical protein